MARTSVSLGRERQRIHCRLPRKALRKSRPPARTPRAPAVSDSQPTDKAPPQTAAIKPPKPIPARHSARRSPQGLGVSASTPDSVP